MGLFGRNDDRATHLIKELRKADVDYEHWLVEETRIFQRVGIDPENRRYAKAVERHAAAEAEVARIEAQLRALGVSVPDLDTRLSNRKWYKDL